MVEKIKVALVGIGNCFSGLIQGIEYYKQNSSQQEIGIIHEKYVIMAYMILILWLDSM